MTSMSSPSPSSMTGSAAPTPASTSTSTSMASSTSHTPRRTSALPRPSHTSLSPPTALRKSTTSPAQTTVEHSDQQYRTPHRSATLVTTASGTTTTISTTTPSTSRSALSRPSLGPRKSISNLRASIGPPAASRSSSATPDGINLRASLPAPSTPSASRPSMSSLSRTPLPPSSHLTPGDSRFGTPTPASSSSSVRHSSRFEPPVPPLDSRYSRSTSSASTQDEPPNLTYADLGAKVQVMNGDETGYRGTLRFLGAIQGKGHHLFAGIELIDEWQTKGRNDGTVGGVQYFATTPNNGIFLLSKRLEKVDQNVPTDAVARPQSALSGRSSRASEVRHGEASDVLLYTGANTPAKRRGSVAPLSSNNSHRPGSAAGIRSSSRASLGPRSESSLGSVANPKTPMRAVPRKSMFEEMREESEAQRRAQASAEHIAAAQKRITNGSRAAQLMNMTAQDLAARKEATGASTSKPSHASPTRVAKDSSPLKDALRDRNRIGRASLGASQGEAAVRSDQQAPLTPGSVPFRPRASRGIGDRINGLAVGDMPPPVPPIPHRPTTPSLRARPTSQLSSYGTTSIHIGFADRRPSSSLSSRAESPLPTEGTTLSKARSIALLEQMDLDATPRRSNVDFRTKTPSRSASRTSVVSDRSADAIAEGLVPIAVYEAALTELSKKDAGFSALREKHALHVAETVREKKKLTENSEIHLKLLEEEREVERQDEKRRRGDSEARAKQALAEADSLKRELKASGEEAVRKEMESSNKVKELEARLRETSSLIDELKQALAAPSAAGEESKVQLAAKDAELEQLRGRLARLETQMESEKKVLNDKIDELTADGQEAIALYEQRLEEAQEEAFAQVEDVEKRMRQLQSKAQEALAMAESQKDDALAKLTASASGGKATAANIDNQSLQEELSHVQEQLHTLEDELEEARSSHRAELDQAKKRKERYAESEAKLRSEMKKLKLDLVNAQNQAKDAKEKVEELLEALRHNTHAQEAERAELEALRAEVGPSVDNHGQHRQASSENSNPEIARLASLLEREKAERRRANDKAQEVQRQLLELRKQFTTQGQEASIESQDSLKRLSATSTSSSSRLSQATSASTSATSTGPSTSLELVGLRSILAMLSDENADLKSRLHSQAEHQSDAEDEGPGERTMDASDLRRNGVSNISNKDLSKEYLDQQEALSAARASIRELRQQLEQAEVDKKEALTTSARETADLEALIEANMWQREELEARIADLERKLKRTKEKLAIARDAPSEIGSSDALLGQKGDETSGNRDVETERGEQDAKRSSAVDPRSQDRGQAGKLNKAEEREEQDDACDDCGSREHTLDNCPLLDQIF